MWCGEESETVFVSHDTVRKRYNRRACPTVSLNCTLRLSVPYTAGVLFCTCGAQPPFLISESPFRILVKRWYAMHLRLYIFDVKKKMRKYHRRVSRSVRRWKGDAPAVVHRRCKKERWGIETNVLLVPHTQPRRHSLRFATSSMLHVQIEAQGVPARLRVGSKEDRWSLKNVSIDKIYNFVINNNPSSSCSHVSNGPFFILI